MVENTIEFGGVAIGIINAQLAVKTTGSNTFNISKLCISENDANIGKNKIVVAVLLVISVKNEISIDISNINNKIFNVEKTNKLVPIHSDIPDFVTKFARLNPPPNKTRIFQGIFVNQSFSRMKS